MSEQEIDTLLEEYQIIYVKSSKAYSYTLSSELSAGTYYFTVDSNYQFVLDKPLPSGATLLFEKYIETLSVVGVGKRYEIPITNGNTGTKLTLTSGAFVGLDSPVPASPFGFGRYEQDLDSGRDMDGVMQRTVLSHHPRKIFLNMPYGMNIKEMKRFLSLIDQSTLYIKAFNPFAGEIQTTQMKMMHGDLVPEVDYWYFDYETQKIDCNYNAISVEIVEY